MYPAFNGKISDGRIFIPELGERTDILEGKNIAIADIGKNKPAETLIGTYKNGRLEAENCKIELESHNDKNVLVVIRHDLIPFIDPKSEERFHLGSQATELDD